MSDANRFPTLADKHNTEALPLAEPMTIQFTVDAADVWPEYFLGQSSLTTIGRAIDGIRAKGYSLEKIFLNGLYYLDSIEPSYIAIDRAELCHHDEPRGRQGEPMRVQRLRDRGVDDTAIYMAGVAALAGVPEVPETALLRELVGARVTHEEIYRAGLHAFAADKLPEALPEDARELVEDSTEMPE